MRVLPIFLLCSFTALGQNLYPNSALQEVPFEQVKIVDSFWLKKIRAIQTVGLPTLFDLAEKQGKIDNFRIVAGRKKGKIRLYNAADSDVYKLLEDAAYSFVHHPDKALMARVDSIIDLIVAAQAPDGYLNTQYMLPFSDPARRAPTDQKVKTFDYGPDVRWRSLYSEWPFGYSQLYSVGHLMEAAVAHFRVTKSHKFLDVAIRLADNIARNFDRTKIEAYGEHPEIEIGLMKLYEVTGNRTYLTQADLFSRYVKFTRPVDVDQAQNSRPLTQQTEAIGHCVRTVYIYSGATNVARATGADDLKNALNRLWNSVVESKMYVHGGTGNGTKAEQHGRPFALPIMNTYSESCAGIAQGQWNHQLNLLHGDARYADIVEIETYNNALASINTDGDRFFYSNKLNIDTVGRKNEHSGVRKTYLFCCPSKVPGFVTGIGRWAYAQTNNALYINQFIGSDVSATIGGKSLRFSTRTNYPWQGNVTITIQENAQPNLSLLVRIQSWARTDTHLPGSPYRLAPTTDPHGYTVSVNGIALKNTRLEQGYLPVRRTWKAGDVLTIQFDMPVRRVYTNETVAANSGRVALLRGPLLYGLEGADNAFDVLQFILPKTSPIQATSRALPGGDAMVLTGQGLLDKQRVTFTAIPYFLWQNRGIHSFATLLIEDEKKIIKEIRTNEKVNTNG